MANDENEGEPVSLVEMLKGGPAVGVIAMGMGFIFWGLVISQIFGIVDLGWWKIVRMLVEVVVVLWWVSLLWLDKHPRLW